MTVDDALILEIVVELGEGPEIADRPSVKSCKHVPVTQPF